MVGKLILVVDDERDIAEIVSELLQGEGYRTTVAYDGQEALAALREHRPDAVVLDIKMPVMDGLEVIHRMRADPAFQDMPIVVLTATRVIKELEQEFRQCRVYHWISKPFESDELVRSVTNALLGSDPRGSDPKGLRT